MVYKKISRKTVARKPPFKPSPSPLKTLTLSLRSCRRHLIKIFSSLALFRSPAKPKKGFRRLPPFSIPNRKTLFLDLDETLVHSITGTPPDLFDFVVHPVIDGQPLTFYVLKRPGTDELLRAAAELYEVVIFTAGLREYASLVVDRLDPEGRMIAHRLYRDSCRPTEEAKLVKDLSRLDRDLGNVMIIDDNPASYALQKENAFPVPPFVGDLADRELVRVIDFLNYAVGFGDTREALALYLSARPLDGL